MKVSSDSTERFEVPSGWSQVFLIRNWIPILAVRLVTFKDAVKPPRRKRKPKPKAVPAE